MRICLLHRGGEIILPAEVEDAVGSHPSVHAAMAFPVQHDILQVRVIVLAYHLFWVLGVHTQLARLPKSAHGESEAGSLGA